MTYVKNECVKQTNDSSNKNYIGTLRARGTESWGNLDIDFDTQRHDQ